MVFYLVQILYHQKGYFSRIRLGLYFKNLRECRLYRVAHNSMLVWHSLKLCDNATMPQSRPITVSGKLSFEIETPNWMSLCCPKLVLFIFSRETILLKFDTNNYNSELSYVPGDHVGIFPANRKSIVDRILGYLQNAPPPDQMILMEFLKETTTPLGKQHVTV